MSHLAEDRGLIMYWDFDEGKGSSTVENISQVQDSIHYVFHSSELHQHDPQWRKGIVGSGLCFDGYSTYIAHSLDKTGIEREAVSFSALTIGVWIAPRSYDWGNEGKLTAIVNRHDMEQKQGYLLGMSRHGSWSFQVGLDTGQWKEVWAPAGYELPKNTWSCIHAVFDSDHGELKLYLNGSEIACTDVPVGARLVQADNTDLLIGRNNHSSVLADVFHLQMFSGILNELKIYNQALNTEQIASAYQHVLDSTSEGTHPQLEYDEIKLDRTPLLQDRHRPQYHASPPAHWMNEPHAPIYFDGQYHLFYQHNPLGPFFYHIHWGHWVSKDLVHWRDLPVALAPEHDDLSPDGIWSGSATYDANGLPVLFFTAANDNLSPNQSVALAQSTYLQDHNPDLVQWTKYPDSLMVQPHGIGAFGDFRDPFVWKEGDRWLALVGSGIEDVGGVALAFSSEDMLNWTYKGIFYQADLQKYPYLGPIWELPVFLPLGIDQQGQHKHILLVSPVGESADVEVFYWIGQWDEQQMSFIPDQEEPQLIDVGDFHFTGPSGMIDPKTNRKIIFTIAQGDRTSELEYQAGWAHNAGLPLSIYLREDGRLGIEPIQELQSLRGKKHVSFQEKSLQEANDLLKHVRGDRLEIQVELQSSTAQNIGIKVRCTPDRAEETLLYYDRKAAQLLVDRTKSTLNPQEVSTGIQGGTLDIIFDRFKFNIYLFVSLI